MTALALMALAAIAAAAAVAGGARTQFKGQPIVIGDITDASLDSTQFAMPPAADGAAAYINSLGGIHGHKVVIKHCDPKADPAATIACANQLIQAHAIANVGLALAGGATSLPVLTKAKIPTFTVATLPQDAASDWFFAVSGNSITQPVAQGKYLTRVKKAQNLVFIGIDLPTVHLIADNFKAGVGTQAKVTEIFYPFGNSDFTSQINKALGAKPDYIVMAGAINEEIRFATGVKAAGFPLDHLMMSGEAVDYTSFFKPGGSNVDGILFTYDFRNWDNLKDKDVALYRKVMAKYEPKAPYLAAYAQATFAAMMMVYKAAQAAKNPTGAAVQAYWTAAKAQPVFMGGIFLKKGSAPAGMPAIRQPLTHIVQWKNGHLVNLTKGYVSF